MIRHFLYSIIICIIFFSCDKEHKLTNKEWENPEITELNRELAHSHFFSYQNQDEAITFQPENSKNYLSLNGRWKFKLFSSPENVPPDFFNIRFDDQAWPEIDVPSNWQLKGFGNAQYPNVSYPFNKVPPQVPQIHNETGCYRLMFHIPHTWNDKEIFIHFEGVQSAMYLWINGEFVGYSQGSMLPSEFDIKRYVKNGANILSVKVLRWCDGSYLEDQEYWALNGIFRDVYLSARNFFHIKDVTVQSTLNKNSEQAKLNIKTKIKNYSKSKVNAGLLNFTLFNSQSDEIIAEHTEPIRNKISPGNTISQDFEITIKKPRLWSAETPYLYAATLSLIDEQGNQVEIIPLKAGIREIKFRNNKYYINGAPLFLKGVFRHEFDPEKGRALTKAQMLKDVLMLKQNNFNAVFTYYPNHRLWYELCNEYGIYVIDAANINCKGMLRDSIIASDIPEWRNALIERGTRLIECNKNNPCVVGWSMGTDAGNGNTLKKMAAEMKENDPTRPIFYHALSSKKLSDQTYVDYISIQNPTLKQIKENLINKVYKPVLISGISKSCGNSNGQLSDYISLTRENPQIQGLFLSGWMKQGLTRKSNNSQNIFTYANQSSSSCRNGLIFPDRQPIPALHEVKKIFQDIQCSLHDKHNGSIRVENQFQFKTFDNLMLKWVITKNGFPVQQGLIDSLDLQPKESKQLTIPYTYPDENTNGEFVLTLSFILRKNEAWADAGHEAAFEQFIIKPATISSMQDPENIKNDEIKIKETTKKISVFNKQFSIEFNKDSGTLQKYAYGSKIISMKGMTPNFWRPPTDNDESGGSRSLANQWRNEKIDSLHFQTDSIHVVKKDKNTVFLYIISSALTTHGKITEKKQIIVHADAQISCTCEIIVNNITCPLPRVGHIWELDPKYSNIQYYGKGPYENYPDRNTGSKIGTYTSTVDEMHVQYIIPQENSLRTEVRWFYLAKFDGNGVLFKAAEKMHFRSGLYSDEMLTNAEYDYELQKEGKTFVFIDGFHMGTGEYNQENEPVHSDYLLHSPSYIFSYSICPINLVDSNIEEIIE